MTPIHSRAFAHLLRRLAHVSRGSAPPRAAQVAWSLACAVTFVACEGGTSHGASAAERASLPGRAQERRGVSGKKPQKPDREARRAQRRQEEAARESATAASAVRTLRLANAAATSERSAAAVSVVAPDVVYTINDSGNDPDLFAFDTTGAARGHWTVRGGRNVDWEAVAVGTCGTAAVPASPPTSPARRDPPRSCVYVGDVGDNARTRPAITLYRFPEPIGAAPARGAIVPEVLMVRYPDRSHNVEAMYVAPDGELVLITKVAGFLLGEDDVRPHLYRVPAAGWGSGRIVTAALVDSLPEFAGGGRKRMVTDAAITPDGRYLAVRTYEWVATFAIDPATGLPRRGAAGALCDIAGLAERQGEGIGFVGATNAGSGRLVFTSEGRDEPLRLANCPLPAR